MIYSKPFIATTEKSLKLVRGQIHNDPAGKNGGNCTDSGHNGQFSSTGAYQIDE